jgi:hypothetical protein
MIPGIVLNFTISRKGLLQFTSPLISNNYLKEIPEEKEKW